MPYTATTYTTGGTATAANLTHGETQYSEATQSFQPNLFTPFVYSGLVATKDGTVLSQLDVTSGTAYVKQTDGTLRERVLTSSTQTTSVASTTYYLDLNPDGTWSWGTAHSATANYLPIASVTTDASANIATVTDARGLDTTLLTGIAGNLTFPGSLTLSSGGSLTVGGGLTVSGASSLAGLTLSGSLSGTSGSFSGAVTVSGALHATADSADALLATITPDGNGIVVKYDSGSGQYILVPHASAGAGSGVAGYGYDGSAFHYSFKSAGSGLFYFGTSRNGTVQLNTVFTGTSTPSGQAVGDIWIAA